MSLLLSSVLPAFDRRLKSMRSECSLRTCHNMQLLRSIPGGRQGISVGANWYCSADCFAAAASGLLVELMNREIVETPRNPRLSLGLALLAKGFINVDQLRLAIAQSPLSGETLEATLLRLHLATDKHLAAARSLQWGFPVLSQENVGQAVEADIPPSLLRSCDAVPLHRSARANRILLGFASDVDRRLLESIERITGYRTEACYITHADLERQWERVIPLPDYKEIVSADTSVPRKMARMVGRSAVEVGARSALFARCKSHIWVRLNGKRGTIDVIFPAGSTTSGQYAGDGFAPGHVLPEWAG